MAIAHDLAIFKKFTSCTISSNETSSQDHWNNIVLSCKSAGEKVLGEKTRKKKIDSPELKNLSNESHKIQLKIEATKDPEKREKLNQERKNIAKKSSKIRAEDERQKFENEMSNLEQYKDDSNRYHAVLRAMNHNTSKESLYVYDKDKNIPSTDNQKANLIANHFQRVLAPDDAEPNNKSYPPCQMSTPFNEDEIKKATSSMKNGKSCGIDGLNAEYLKYAPTEVHRDTANLLNKIAATGDHPDELKLGILSPLPKPGKPKGPPENLRPIVLLSIIRKILTICILRRTWERLKHHISTDQAAYQGGRSTTEQVFAVKMLVEKAITSSNFKLYELLLDMSKAFDTVNRNKLFTLLEKILLPEELHLLHLLTNNVKLKVRVGSEFSEEFKTIIGIMQGDCLSAVLFIFYLAKALDERSPVETEHNYALTAESCPFIKPPALEDHNYANPPKYERNPNEVTIEPKYADDITYVSTSQPRIRNTEATVPKKLKAFNLGVNHGKTERYECPDPPNTKKDDSWKSCKLLGSLIDTENDIARRKALALATLNKKKDVYKSKNLSIQQKIRHFCMFVQSTLLYNSELWALTNTLNNKLDAFHRRILRYAIGFHWPKKISNEDLYRITKQIPLSRIIQKRRLSWFGHLMRLPETTPARIAFNVAVGPKKRKRGRPKHIWLNTIQDDLNELNIDIKLTTENIPELIDLCKDRNAYRNRTQIKCDTGCGMRGKPARQRSVKTTPSNRS